MVKGNAMGKKTPELVCSSYKDRPNATGKFRDVVLCTKMTGCDYNDISFVLNLAASGN
jgi:hypothetical protein